MDPDAQRFRQLSLRISGPRKLHDDIRHWREALTGGCVSFVRVLKISGNTISAEQEETQEPGRRIRWQRWLGLPHGYEEDEDEPLPLTGMDNPLTAHPALPRPSTAWPDEEPWKALADLCRELPQLEDVVFASWDQFPRVLLDALHDCHPQSRLHVHYFGLRSLIHSELGRPAMHPDDVALATSPCLYSIAAVTSEYRSPQIVDYNEEAVMEIAAGLAPRLANVCILQAFHQASQARMRTVTRPPWQGFPSDLVKGGREQQASKGSIRHLRLSTGQVADKLPQWACLTDFSQLQSLTLRDVGISSVTQLTGMARQNSITSLKSLDIGVTPRRSVREREVDVEPAVVELLETLRPLQGLVVYGSIQQQCFNAVIACHSATLQALELHGTGNASPFLLSHARAEQLARHCHQLEELNVLVARTQGDENETAIYRCLSRLPRLTHLTLYPYFNFEADAEADQGRVWRDSGFIPFSGLGTSDDSAVTISTLQNAYKAAAIDSSLAIAMFRLLGRRNLLRTLEIRPYGYNKHSDFGNWLRWLARTWRVRRDGAGEIAAKELGVAEREEAGKELKKPVLPIELYEGRERVKEAWDGLWPPHSAQWWDEWCSMPLKLGSDWQE